MAAPKIRFKGFTNDWEQRKFGECYKMSSGYAFKYQDYCDNGVPLINGESIQHGNVDDSNLNFLPDDFLEQYSDFVLHEKDIVVGLNRPITNGNLKIARIPKEYNNSLLYQRAGKIQYKCDMDEDFSYVLLSKEILNFTLREAVGSDQPFISTSKLDKWEMKMPESKKEQAQIGTFLINLDNLITLHQRKCDDTKQLKKFMLSKMFPKNGAKRPEIRFEGFTDDWEQRKLGNICERVTRKNKNNESDLPLTIASQYGLIDQRDFFNKVIAAKDMLNYYLLKKGEFAYNKSYSNGFDYGSIKRLNAYEQGCLSTLYICFGLVSDEVDSDYLQCYFDTLQWYGDVSQICAEGARNHGLLNVDTKAFFEEVSINMPSSIKEQKKISGFLNNLDNLITLHQRKCDTLKELKRYMLQNMFA